MTINNNGVKQIQPQSHLLGGQLKLICGHNSIQLLILHAMAKYADRKWGLTLVGHTKWLVDETYIIIMSMKYSWGNMGDLRGEGGGRDRLCRTSYYVLSLKAQPLALWTHYQSPTVCTDLKHMYTQTSSKLNCLHKHVIVHTDLQHTASPNLR